MLNAQTEYDKRVGKARSNADAKFKKAYEKIINENESIYKKSLQQIKENHSKELDSFYSEVKNRVQNIHSFNDLLEKLFFKNCG